MTFKPDEMQPSDLGGQDDTDWEIQVPITELPGIWEKVKWLWGRIKDVLPT